ncbi:hypothetical protein K439DRAFT_1618457 [Ramaria rubella]|nr:hypothetical protein K439DRAFT_1618457 [Ramaria rubella]
MSIALDKAELISLFVECILYGVFCVTFIACVWILVFKRSTNKINHPLVATAVIMWMLSTAHVVIDLRRILEAFYYQRNAPGGPVGFFIVVSHTTNVLKSAIYITDTCVSDCLIIYRTHIVVRNKSITTLLLLMVLATAVSGYGSIYMLVHTPPSARSIFATSLAPWVTSFNILTVATNIIATALIAGRIWIVSSRVHNLTHRRSTALYPVVEIIVESGAIYAASLILLTVLYTTGNNAQYIVLDAVTPLIRSQQGIVFSLIIIRVALQTNHQQNHVASTWTGWGLSTLPPAVPAPQHAESQKLAAIKASTASVKSDVSDETLSVTNPNISKNSPIHFDVLTVPRGSDDMC